MQMHNITLSPDAPVKFTGRKTIGYIGGDLPFITIHNEGQRFDVYRGQVIPADGHYIGIENIFNRTANVDIVLDAPVNLTMPQSRNEEFSKYRTAFRILEAVGVKLGCAFMLTSGRARVTLDSSTLFEIKIYHNASQALLEARPAGFMGEVLGSGAISAPTHVNGGTMKNLVMLAGEYTDALALDWMAATGYAGPVSTYSTRSDQFSIVIEPDMAVFIVRNTEAKEFRPNIEIEDLGAFRREGVV